MSPAPAIDIVICTYNRASGLDAVLENLSRQSCGEHAQWRVLVVDNASTDTTADVVAIGIFCRTYAMCSSRCRA